MRPSQHQALVLAQGFIHAPSVYDKRMYKALSQHQSLVL
jgi:hypothetical protein